MGAGRGGRVLCPYGGGDSALCAQGTDRVRRGVGEELAGEGS